MFKHWRQSRPARRGDPLLADLGCLGGVSNGGVAGGGNGAEGSPI